MLGHEPVGVIVGLGKGVQGYKLGQRVVVGAVSPCFVCNFCQGGLTAQCGGKMVCLISGVYSWKSVFLYANIIRKCSLLIVRFY